MTSLQRFLVAAEDDDTREAGEVGNPINSCTSSFVKGVRFLLDVIAFVYALYTTSLFFIVILMWAFSILITIYVSISSGETWAQLFAVGLGIPMIGPMINVLDEAFIIVVRTLRVGFQSELRPHVFEFLLLPCSFSDSHVTHKHRQSRNGDSSNFETASNISLQNMESRAVEQYFNKFVLCLAAIIPPKSFTLQQKLVLNLGIIDLITICVFLQSEVTSGLAIRAFVSLVFMLLCSVIRFARSSPKSLDELHARLATSRSARWVKYTTGGASFFILASCAASGFWADRSDVYTFALATFGVFFGTLGGLMLLVVCICPAFLHLFPCLNLWGSSGNKNTKNSHYANLDSNAATGEDDAPSGGDNDADTADDDPSQVIVESVKSRYVTVVSSLLLWVLFIVIFFNRGVGSGDIDVSDVSAGHRWWSLVVWVIVCAVAVAHTVGDKEQIDEFETLRLEAEERERQQLIIAAAAANNNDDDNGDNIIGSDANTHRPPRPAASKNNDPSSSSAHSLLESAVKRQNTNVYEPPRIPSSAADTDSVINRGGADSTSSPPLPRRENEEEEEPAFSAEGCVVNTRSSVMSERELVSSPSTPNTNGNKNNNKNTSAVPILSPAKTSQFAKSKRATKITKKTARFFVGTVTAVFFLVVGLMTALNFPSTIPALSRTYDYAVLSERKQPYTICAGKWGTADRFNATDMVLIAKAAYYDGAEQVQQALELWFDEPLNVTDTHHYSAPSSSNGDHSKSVGGSGGHTQSLGVRAYRITFFEANRTVASALPAGEVPQPWMHTTYVSLPRVDVVAVRGSHNGLDWLQDAYVWGDSIFFSIFDRMSPFSLPQSVVNSLVKWSKSLRYGVFGDISYFSQLRAITLEVMEDSKLHNSSQVMIVGHSLGGGLAQLVGSALDIVAFAVSGVGIGYQATAADFSIDDVRGYQSNIVPAYDPVPQIDLQIGEVQNIACSAAPNPLGCHSLQTTWGELARACSDIRNTNDRTGQATPIVGEALTQVGIWLFTICFGAILFRIRIVKSLLRIFGLVEEATINVNSRD